MRRDGFTGDITLALKNAPAGFLLSGACIPAGQDKVRLTLTVPASRMGAPLKLYLEGVSTFNGREVRHMGIPSVDMTQAFEYHHLVPSNDWMIRIEASRGRDVEFAPTAQWKLLVDQPVKLPAGGTVPVKAFVPLGHLRGEIRAALSEPPEGITIQDASPVPNGIAFTLRADPAKVKPGLRGNLMVDAFLERAVDPSRPSQPKSRRSGTHVALGPLPAISFEIVGATEAGK